MKSKKADVNKIASFFINKDEKVALDVENSSYKRLMTFMAYAQLNYIKKYKCLLFDNSLRRDGIVVSITNLIPDKSKDYLDLDKEVLDFLELEKQRNISYTKIDIDRIHKSLLDEFYNPGELKILELKVEK